MITTSKTDAAEAAAWRVFCELSKYRSANEPVSLIPEFTQALSNAHAK